LNITNYIADLRAVCFKTLNKFNVSLELDFVCLLSNDKPNSAVYYTNCNNLASFDRPLEINMLDSTAVADWFKWLPFSEYGFKTH